MIHLDWGKIISLCSDLVSRNETPSGVYGIPSGGSNVALIVSNMFHCRILNEPEDNCLIVDDIIDSGKTFQRKEFENYKKDALIRKTNSPKDIAPHAACFDDWIVFPWENTKSGPEDSVIRLLQFIGEDPNRDGLIETPKRVLKAWKEITEGYNQNPEEILSKTFDVKSDEMIFVKNIRFHSTCEHHLLPFSGHATVSYIPEDRVVGLSKIARLVECFAKRLQVQERMTTQIADSIETILKAKGVGVIIEAHHSCMGCRGIKKEGASMITSALRGLLKTSSDARMEFLTISRSK